MSEQPDADVIPANRRYWDHLAPHRHGEPVPFFAAGGSALTSAELAVIGDVTGKRVLQLAGSVGDEGISFALRGAEVTVVDLAEDHLATGRAKAAALGLSMSYVSQDMMRLDDDLTGFDIVYISSGGICWAPDITAWAGELAPRLSPGGVVIINEHHPLWEVVSVDGPARLSVSGNYLEPSRHGYDDPAKAPQVTRELGVPEVEPRSFVWSLGRVVTAVADAGLIITSLTESAEPEMYEGLGDDASRVPATYLLTAVRPES